MYKVKYSVQLKESNTFLEKALEQFMQEDNTDAVKEINVITEESGKFVYAPSHPRYREKVLRIFKIAEEMYYESMGMYKSTVSIAVDGRIDIEIWANKDMSEDAIRNEALDVFRFADLSKMDVVGSKPVYIEIPKQSYDHDF
ncbi:MAG: hypothetical protein K6G84_13370 [Lachnospiraceae bacterium]|nr:hypothetical protein [Lachnospiraceae bacterium]